MAKVKARRLNADAALTGWRRVLVLVALAAFALQSYVIQTHIHLPASAGHAVSRQQDHHDKYPPGEDPANCPICQEILHSGAFVTPAAQSLLPPVLAVSAIALVDTALPHIFAPSHNWRGRAPPSR